MKKPLAFGLLIGAVLLATVACHAQAVLGFSNHHGFPNVVTQGNQYNLSGWIVNSGFSAYSGVVNIELEANGLNLIGLDNNFAISSPLQPGDSIFWSRSNYNFSPGQLRLGNNDVIIWPTVSGGSAPFDRDSLETPLYFTDGAAFFLHNAGFEVFGGRLQPDMNYPLYCRATNLGEGVNTHDMQLMVRVAGEDPKVIAESSGFFEAGLTVDFAIPRFNLMEILDAGNGAGVGVFDECVEFYVLEAECVFDALNVVKIEFQFATGNMEARFPLKPYPNPTNGMLYFDLPTEWDPASIAARVLDVAGREMLARQVSGNQLDISTLPAGAYIVELLGAAGIARMQVIRR